MSGISARSSRTRIRRMPKRGHHDRETLHRVLDAGFLAHVGYVVDGYPVVTPTLYWREGDAVYWHGSSASRMIDVTCGAEVCLTVSHVDGVVLARCAFNHSVNYRSAMLFGTARAIDDPDAKLASLRAMMEGVCPGRWERLRAVSGRELKATRILWMPIEEASAKIRTGGPLDDPADLDARVWAGVIPMATTFGAPQPEAASYDPDCPPELGRRFD